MTDEPDGTPRRQPTPPIDGPTVMGPSTGHLQGPAPEEPTVATPIDEPTLPEPASPVGPTVAPPVGPPPSDETTIATPPTTWSPGPAPDDEATAPEPTPARPDGPTPISPPLSDETTITTWSNGPPPDAPAPSPAWSDGPTVATPVGPPPSDETTIATPPTTWSPGPAPDDEATAPEPTPARPDGPTVATPVGPPPSDETTIATPPSPAWPDGPTVATPVDPPPSDEPTTSVVDESPTTTGPTVASWPLDELLLPPPTDLVWRPDVPEPPPAPRRPAYYVALGASVVLVVALIAVAALMTVVRPTREVAGTASPGRAIPEITGSAPPPAPTTTTTATADGPGTHPLSTSTARMADATCALPRFDLADDRQAAFYTAAKTCADDAWRGVLDEAGLAGGTVEVVTVTGPVQTASCGEITPASPSTQCDGTVYMTPARLRDTEQNGRYPGRYFGVFLREYARALQFTTGLAELAADVDDADTRLAQQATCMAGIASGAMANRGAVDANITGEISDRLTSVDAPPDAKAMLDKGSQERTLNACDTWK